MAEQTHHDNITTSVAKEYADILNTSEQGVYLYLDDSHKVCNENFSNLLGYDAPKDWAAIETSFPEAFVAEKSQEVLVSAFQNAMEKNVASTNNITWKRKDGSTVDTEVILVPIVHNGHLLALHFVSSK